MAIFTCRLPLISAALLIFLLLAACSPAKQPAVEPYWPTKDWRTATPEEQGVDSQILADMLEHIEQTDLNLHSLLIIRHGYIVSETYYDGFEAKDRHLQYSVTKSFAATLTGIAIDQGLISGVDTSLSELFPGRSFEHLEMDKSAITLEDILTMRTGLDWQEGDPAYNQLYNSPDWVDYMLALPMNAPPGEIFNYCSGCSHLLTAAVTEAAGMPARKFAEQNLFKPLGIVGVRWDTDHQAIPVGGWGLKLTPREMARLGYLYLHNGEWDGQQIVSAKWVEAATQEHTHEPNGDRGYGYQWWTYPQLEGYMALGRDGQTIFVIPSADLVIVTTAKIDGHDAIFDLIEDYIVPAVNE